MSKVKTPLVLAILDGWGIGDVNDKFNAIARGNTPFMDKLTKENLYTTVKCSGEEVGLPKGQMGNSEVGHLNMGSGRIIYQELTRISKSIKDGDFFTNKAFLDVMEKAKENNSALHLLGLVSDGGVHSHQEHLYALLKLAKEKGLKKVYVHAFLDGRDVPPSSAKGYLKELESKIKEIGIGNIATISGRYYAMDRDKRWERVEKAYNVLVYREGLKASTSAEAITNSYKEEVVDEFVIPTVITGFEGSENANIKENDSIIFFNFRPDRAREMTSALKDPDFDGFKRNNGFFNLNYVSMTEYDETFKELGVVIAFPPSHQTHTLGQICSEAGLSQLRIAETEKYAHVTYFFNGGEEVPFEHEDRILIPSPKVATYDLKPEMSALEVTDKLVEEITSGKYDIIVVNYANGDMVGHTGVLEAAIKAVETVDKCLERVVEAVKEVNGTIIVTADHGNAEVMVDKKEGKPFTAHTTNPVPVVLVSDYYKDNGYKLREDGILADITPTILEIKGIKAPSEVTGKSLLYK